MVTTTVEALLMPLAQRRLPAFGPDEEGRGAPERLDPRFDALRGERKWRHHLPDGHVEAVWDLDASLEAVVGAMGACDMSIDFLTKDVLDSTWACRMQDNRGQHFWSPWSATPEEALARCLVALVEAQEKEGAT